MFIIYYYGIVIVVIGIFIGILLLFGVFIGIGIIVVYISCGKFIG